MTGTMIRQYEGLDRVTKAHVDRLIKALASLDAADELGGDAEVAVAADRVTWLRRSRGRVRVACEDCGALTRRDDLQSCVEGAGKSAHTIECCRDCARKWVVVR